MIAERSSSRANRLLVWEGDGPGDAMRIMKAHGRFRCAPLFSIGRLGVATGADYYLERVANSVDDYYLGHGEAPGQWIGATSASLGLTGEVDPAALRNLLDGRAADGTDLGIVRREKRRPGYDLTFSAPKSVSLLWTFGSPEVRDTVSDLPTTGPWPASSTTCRARRVWCAGGQTAKTPTPGPGSSPRHFAIAAAGPVIRSSTPTSSCPTSSSARTGAGALPDGRQLYRWQKAASAMYQSALRAELSCLGLAWEVRRSGLGEVAGVPQGGVAGVLQAPGGGREGSGRSGARLGPGRRRWPLSSTRSAKPEVTVRPRPCGPAGRTSSPRSADPRRRRWLQGCGHR